jgi:hypothetical protein
MLLSLLDQHMGPYWAVTLSFSCLDEPMRSELWPPLPSLGLKATLGERQRRPGFEGKWLKNSGKKCGG